MKYFTKEWHKLMESLGSADIYEPVLDKEYTDEDIKQLYEEAMERYVDEERIMYDEPPFVLDEDLEFDPEEVAAELEEYENRPPFDEEESRQEFAEMYKDNLEEPDEDLPAWVKETVDPRLLAMYLLPEHAHRRLVEEEAEKQAEFDRLDEEADEAMEAAMDAVPDEWVHTVSDLDDFDGDYVIDISTDGGGLELVCFGWDDEGDPVKRTAAFSGTEIIEKEDFAFEVEEDEDGDLISTADLLYHEVYYADGRFEVHFMFDNDGDLRYLTFSCDRFTLKEVPA